MNLHNSLPNRLKLIKGFNKRKRWNCDEIKEWLQCYILKEPVWGGLHLCHIKLLSGVPVARCPSCGPLCNWLSPGHCPLHLCIPTPPSLSLPRSFLALPGLLSATAQNREYLLLFENVFPIQPQLATDLCSYSCPEPASTGSIQFILPPFQV